MARPLGSKNKPKLPGGSLPASATRHDSGVPATTAVTPGVVVDGFMEAFTGGATRRNPAGSDSAFMIASQPELLGMYLSNGLARRIVDIPAEDMTRAGFTLENMPDETLERVQARCEELDVLRHMNDALRWSRLFGGSVIVLGINDGRPLDMPANLEGAKDLEFLRVYDRFQASVIKHVEDPMLKEYGQPEVWQISPVRNATRTYNVHNSRVLTFDGESIPDAARNMQDGWGGSVLVSCRNELIRLGMSHYWANALLERSSQAIHAMPGLGNVLKTVQGEKHLQQRAMVVDMVRSIINTIVIDKEETYTLESASLTGIGDLLDRFAELLSAVTGIPIYRLMGRSPGGLNATGEANEVAWHEWIQSMQNDILRRPLDTVISIICRSLSNNDGGDYKLVFNPLRTPSGIEAADISLKEAQAEKTRAEALQIHIDAGVMSAAEARVEVADDYGLDTEIDVKRPQIEVMQYEAELAAEAAKNAPAADPATTGGAE